LEQDSVQVFISGVMLNPLSAKPLPEKSGFHLRKF